MTELEKEAKAFLKKLDDESGTVWTEDDEEIVKAFAKFAESSQYVERQKIAFAVEQLKLAAKKWNENKVRSAFKMEIYKSPDEIILGIITELEKLNP